MDQSFYTQHCIFAPPTFYIMSHLVTMRLAENAGDGLSRKHIVETYGHEDLGSLALAAIYSKANQMVDYRIGHVSYEAHYMFLNSLATAITLYLMHKTLVSFSVQASIQIPMRKSRWRPKNYCFV